MKNNQTLKKPENKNLLENTHFQDKEKKLSHSPLVSIIVPIYNVEKYLRQCLDSIITQTLKDIEIILVNDGSTDNCGVICDEYALKDKRIQVIHKTNAGLGAAYNTGLEMASGEYIGFVESDDWIEPNMYEELYAKAKETDVDVCLSGYFLNNNQSTKKELQLLESIDDSIFNILNYPQLLMKHSSIWCKLYNRNFIIKNGIFFNEFDKKNNGYYCDIPFWTKVCCCAKSMTKIDICYYHYRLDNPNASSVNSRSDKVLLNIINALEDMYDITVKYKKISFLRKEIIYNIILTAFRYFTNIDIKYKKNFFNSFRKLLLKTNFNIENDFVNFGNDYLDLLRKEFAKAVKNNNYNVALRAAENHGLNAEKIIKNHLSYRYGNVLLNNHKSFFSILKIPYLFLIEYKRYKKFPKSFIPLKKYKDYTNAINIKNFFSYKLGQEIVKLKNPLYIFFIPFNILKIYNENK
ncbi:glycosyltransferase, partial [Campylobacter coli]|nr:glycosyltransferase [Campylobacter coli]